MVEYKFKTPPFPHQREEFLKHARALVRGILWEQGTGKTKLEIDTASLLWLGGEINGLFVVAPNGVHRNWITEEIPTHMPADVRMAAHCYSGEQHHTKGHEAAVNRLLKTDSKDLAVLAMSYDSLMTEHGRKLAKEFLTKRRCLYILDESRRVKSPTAKRTKRVLASGVYAPYRRILNGTPVTNGPFDIYSQIDFLDPTFWPRHGISSFAGFKVTFAEFKPIKVAGGRIINVVDSYKNLDMLARWLDEICTRVTKDQVLKDLPPKLFSRRTFVMTNEQRRVYEALRDEFIALLRNGEEVSAPIAITRLLRFQQVTCGYLPSDGDGILHEIDANNPRLDLLQEICEDLPHKAIIWARFKNDIDKICRVLPNAVRYDGSVGDEDRATAIERFQRGDAQFFVANAQAAGEGLTLHAAQTVIYYSQDFNLGNRLQSEDRAHRIGQMHPVNYIDFAAVGTVDEHIATSLAKKLDVACRITGDNLRDWLA